MQTLDSKLGVGCSAFSACFGLMSFVYFKHKEAGIGPTLAKEMVELLKEDS